MLKTGGVLREMEKKDGFIRGQALGSRVALSARTCLTNGADLAVSQLGVPLAMTMQLTRGDKVNMYNLALCTTLVLLGPQSWDNLETSRSAHLEQMRQLMRTKEEYMANPPMSGMSADCIRKMSGPMYGAVMIVMPDGRRQKVPAGNTHHAQRLRAAMALRLAPGCIVHRQLRDTDAVIDNRQPSLHKGSMTGFDIVRKPQNSLSFRSENCPPFNADFDGDEMNIHVPQGELAQAELRFILHVRGKVVLDGTSRAAIGGSWNVISGWYLLTRADELLGATGLSSLPELATACWTDNDAARAAAHSLMGDALLPRPCMEMLLGQIGWSRARVMTFLTAEGGSPCLFEDDDGGRYHGGWTLLDAILPPGLYYEAAGVRIVGGRLQRGALGGGHLGANKPSAIAQAIANDYGGRAALDFLSASGTISTLFLRQRGLTMSLADLQPSEVRAVWQRNTQGYTLMGMPFLCLTIVDTFELCRRGAPGNASASCR